MAERYWQHVWVDECEAVNAIKARDGLEPSIDYALGEKLLAYIQRAAQRRDCPRELHRFVSRLTILRTSEETQTHLARIERDRPKQIPKSVAINEYHYEDAGVLPKSDRQSHLVMELLSAPLLGTS